MARLRKNDTVQVMAGRDRGKKGKLIRVYAEKNTVLVEGVNVVKKHTRATRENPKGGIVTMERPIAISNVMVVCGRCGKATRIAYKILADKTKKRICKKCQEIL